LRLGRGSEGGSEGGSGSVFIIQIDTLFCSAALTAAVYEAIGARVAAGSLPPREHLVFVASHTHGAPSLDPTKPLLGAVNKEYFDAVVEKLAVALVSLLQGAARPCSLAYGAAQEHKNLAVARRRRSVFINRAWPYVHFGTVMQPNPKTPFDRTIRLAVLRRADDAQESTTKGGTERAVECVVWGWACHPVLYPDTAAVSADYVGHVRRAVRRHVGADVPVVFLPGFAGDLRPRIVTRRPSLRARLALPFGAVFRPAETAEYEQWCGDLGAQICNLYEAVAGRMAGEAGAQDEACAVPSVRCAEVDLSEIIDGDNGGKSCPLAVLSLKMPDGRGICWPLVGAEALASYDAPIRAAMDAGCEGKSVWPVAYYDAVFGYLPDDSHIAQGGYEAQRFFGSFGLNGRFKPNVQGRIVAAFQRLFEGGGGAV